MVTKQEAQSSERGRHAKYKKFMSRTSTFYAHDEKNEAKVGDRVLIFECRPLSKSKRWKLAQILERGEAVEG
jgi:small subunit ribosomal protein S17